MKKIILLPLFIALVSSFFFISWTPTEEKPEFPYQLYDYNTDIPIYNYLNPSDNINEIDNPIANLGRVLFYDKKLSADDKSSCASCHKQEFSFGDNTPFSEGSNGVLTKRNSNNLNDLGWQQSGGFFWDFSVQTLHEAVLQPIINPDELGLQIDDLIEKLEGIDYYPPLFNYAFDDEDISAERIADAISEFIKSMNTLNSKNDNIYGQHGSRTSEEMLGYFLFQQNCNNCHKESQFGTHSNRSPFSPGNFSVLNNGLDSVFTDLGYGAIAQTSNNFSSNLYNGYFKTPTLRNLSFTAPYMHDGRFETLEEVIEFYSTGIQENPTSFGLLFYYGAEIDTLNGERGFLYTDEEKSNLLSYLKTLDDPNLTTNEKWGNPFLETPIEITEEDNIELDIFAAPNPVQESTTINISNARMEVYDLYLYNMEGKLIRQEKTDGGSHTLYRDNLPSGVYYLQIQNEDFKYSLKLLFD